MPREEGAQRRGRKSSAGHCGQAIGASARTLGQINPITAQRVGLARTPDRGHDGDARLTKRGSARTGSTAPVSCVAAVAGEKDSSRQTARNADPAVPNSAMAGDVPSNKCNRSTRIRQSRQLFDRSRRHRHSVSTSAVETGTHTSSSCPIFSTWPEPPVSGCCLPPQLAESGHGALVLLTSALRPSPSSA